MEAAQIKDIDRLITKVKEIMKGPNRDLLRQFVDILYEHGKTEVDYDEEPLSPEELAAVQEAEEAIRRGDKEYFTPWEDVKKELGL
jgi:hypothetical protein